MAKESLGQTLSAIRQRAQRSLVPTSPSASLESIVIGMREAEEITAAEFAAPYHARIAELEAQIANTATLSLVTQKNDAIEAARTAIIERDTAVSELREKCRHCNEFHLPTTKLEAENKALREAISSAIRTLESTTEQSAIGAAISELQRAIDSRGLT